MAAVWDYSFLTLTLFSFKKLHGKLHEMQLLDFLTGVDKLTAV